MRRDGVRAIGHKVRPQVHPRRDDLRSRPEREMRPDAQARGVQTQGEESISWRLRFLMFGKARWNASHLCFSFPLSLRDVCFTRTLCAS